MQFWIWNIIFGNCKDLSVFLLELIENKSSLILGRVGLSSSTASFFSSLWVTILRCVGYNLSVTYKMSEESRIRSCSSEISDNLNLFSITHIEYGLSLSRYQLNSELLSSGVFFLLTKGPFTWKWLYDFSFMLRCEYMCLQKVPWFSYNGSSIKKLPDTWGSKNSEMSVSTS